jgi:hypothetical protein
MSAPHSTINYFYPQVYQYPQTAMLPQHAELPPAAVEDPSTPTLTRRADSHAEEGAKTPQPRRSQQPLATDTEAEEEPNTAPILPSFEALVGILAHMGLSESVSGYDRDFFEWIRLNRLQQYIAQLRFLTLYGCFLALSFIPVVFLPFFALITRMCLSIVTNCGPTPTFNGASFHCPRSVICLFLARFGLRLFL